MNLQQHGAGAFDTAQVAYVIFSHFRRYRADFEKTTAGARVRFETADWNGTQEAGVQRLANYNRHVAAVLQEVPALAPPNRINEWPLIKSRYIERIDDTEDAELAQTFFNSVHRAHSLDGPPVAAEMFLHDSGVRISRPARAVSTRFTAALERDRPTLIRDVLENFKFTLPWRDLDADVRSISSLLAIELPDLAAAAELTIEMITVPFFRNKGVYLIGRIRTPTRSWPLALPLLRTESGELYVDTVICDADQMSVLFSFTRAYFMVDVPRPSVMIDFLQALLPAKKRSELYAGIGLHKHGKTEFYRGFLKHLADSEDAFVIAPGIKGMVMAVFLLPSYQTVFKVIKDRFPPQKNVTATQVIARYHIVKTHDRVGRMADTQEFENFRFPKARLSRDLLDELYAVCRSAIIDDGDYIIIRHLYTERQMITLNLYVESCNDDELTNALEEYGNAISQLAAANIFPGDMLFKNFGVTRHGRVVFYDYDEIEYLTDVTFHNDVNQITARTAICPEDFTRFLPDKRNIREIFYRLHPRLFTTDFWLELQHNVRRGKVSDVYPYRQKKRFTSQPHPVVRS